MSLQSHGIERGPSICCRRTAECCPNGTMISYLVALQKAEVLVPAKRSPAIYLSVCSHTRFPSDRGTENSSSGRSGRSFEQRLCESSRPMGRYKKDTDSGVLNSPTGVIWSTTSQSRGRMSYGSILSDRDINEHSLNFPLHHMPADCIDGNIDPLFTAEKLVEIMASKVALMPATLLCSIIAKVLRAFIQIIESRRSPGTALHAFWTQSALYCDWSGPCFLLHTADMSGATPEESRGSLMQ